jgi:hypothetical protein
MNFDNIVNVQRKATLADPPSIMMSQDMALNLLDAAVSQLTVSSELRKVILSENSKGKT